MNDGTRTHDNRDHNPGLYQLSYAHHIFLLRLTLLKRMVRPAGFEPATLGLEGRCSIQMSYGRLINNVTVETYRYFFGVEGFEPPTPCSQSRCATRLRYTPSIHLYRVRIILTPMKIVNDSQEDYCIICENNDGKQK